MKQTTFESRAKEAFGDVYGKIKELEDKAKQLRAQLDDKLEEQPLQDTYHDVKQSSRAAAQDIRQGVEQASSALSEAIKKATNHFK